MEKKLLDGLLALAGNFQGEGIAAWQNSILMGLMFYCLPAILCRLVMGGKPLPRKWGSLIAMIYGLTVTTAALAASIFYMGNYSGGLVAMSLVWIWLEYKILTIGGKKETEAGDRRKIRFCPYCGARLREDSRYCPQCGARAQREEYKGPEL